VTNPILTDLSHATLARASKENLTDFFQFLRRAPSVEFAQQDGLARWVTHVPHPWFNGIYVGRRPRSGDDAFLSEAARHFAHHGVSLFTLWIDVDQPRSDWEAILTAHGYRYDAGAPGMAYVLDRLPRALDLPAGFEIRSVNDTATLAAWCRTFLAGFELPAVWFDAVHGLMKGLGLGFPMADYLGYLDGEPVATSNLFYSAGVAGVGFVSTVPAARRRGLGGLMTLHPLYDARERGYRAAILQASDMGYSVYQGIGFEHIAHVDNYFKKTGE
jgi:GNAT superfamily N-acetyltransferase